MRSNPGRSAVADENDAASSFPRPQPDRARRRDLCEQFVIRRDCAMQTPYVIVQERLVLGID
jgi:hypothetical protein